MSDPNTSPDTPDESSTTDGSDSQDSPRSGLLGGRMWAAAAAVAIGVIAAVVIVSLNTGSGDDAADTSGAVEISSEQTTDADTADAEAESEPDTADAAQAFEVRTTGAFEINVEPTDAGVAAITVTDSATPTIPGTDSQHCVLVTLAGPTTVESYGCSPLGATEPVQLTLSTPGAPLVGCAAVATRETPGEPTGTDATTNFVVAQGDALPAGDYDMTVAAVTGFGDGCAPADGPGEHEATAETTIPIG